MKFNIKKTVKKKDIVQYLYKYYNDCEKIPKGK